jgi:two-component system, NtrC family, response regulator HydG
MPPSSTLLVSSHPRLTRIVQQAHDRSDLLRLEICGVLEKARARFKADDLALVLIHLTSETDIEEVRKLLREAAACSGATTALVCDSEAAAAQGRALLLEGAADLVCLPADSAKLVELMTTAGRRAVPPFRPTGAPAAVAAPAEPADLMLIEPEHLAQVRQIVDQDTTILLTGETGTGKTMLARHVHQLSARRTRPFMIIDCGALAPALIESEMFGHVRGAFTGADKDRVGKFAAAGDGTLVLDEINSLPLALQSKLLRAVEDRAFEPLGSNQTQTLRARIIAISNVSLHDEVAQNRFRADLYYRLNVVGFRLPRLRERRADILPLARKFLSEHPVARSRGVIGISPAALEALEAYAWPGNVRELRNVIERVAVLCTGRVVNPVDLPETIREPAPAAVPMTPVATVPPAQPAGPDDELWRICEALRKHRNNRVRAAAELGMSRVSLYKKLHKYGLFEKNPATTGATAVVG